MNPRTGAGRAESSSSRALEVFAAFVAEHGDDAHEAADAAFEKLCGERRELETQLRELWTNWKQAGGGAPPNLPPSMSLSGKLKELFGADVDPGVSIDDPVKTPEESALFAKYLGQLRERGATRTRYVVRGLLGHGGMGVVYSVWDEDLRRQLAMKVIRGKGERDGTVEPPRVGRATAEPLAATDAPPAPIQIDPASLGRFLEEAQITGQLHHPGIVPVHEIGLDADGRVYFTMRQVKGETLAQVIEKIAKGDDPTWNETRALSVIVAVCDALAYAHERGVIHRDLKPANVMVGRFGETYVMDWGLARVLGTPDRHDVLPHSDGSSAVARDGLEASSGMADRSDDSRLVTMDGMVVGTPAYMPPEQAFGRADEIDRRSDVYSVGAMLYHLLTRRMPYVEPGERTSPYKILAAVRAGPPKRVHELRADVPAELEAICDKAMARARDERYVDPQAFAADLRAFLEHRVVNAYETGAAAELRKWVERNRALAASLAIVVLLIVGGTSFNAWQSRRHAETISKKNVELEERLDEVNRLADVKRVRDLEARARGLWPAWPQRVPEMEIWIADARAIVARLPAHEQSLAKLRDLASRPDADTQVQWWHEQLEELVAAIRKLDGPLAEPPDAIAAWKPSAHEDAPAAAFVARAATLGAMQRRIDHAAWVEKASLDDEVDAWAAAIARIEQNPKYGGQKLTEQVGLVPIGCDPASGLEEFWHAESGACPRRDEKSGRVVISDTTGLVFVLIPGGSFTMGSRLPDAAHPQGSPNVDSRSRTNERPAHEVTLPPFFLSKFEMTQAQWLRAAGSNPSWFTAAGVGIAYPLTSPVEQVSWTDVHEETFRLGVGLPTEAQWEYAARAGTTTVWWTGDDVSAIGPARGRAGNVFDERATAAEYSGSAESWDDGFRDVAPVGSFAANRFGLHDVLGNVLEWCEDEYVDDYVSRTSAGGGRGMAAVQAGSNCRVVRGGGWNADAASARSAYRYPLVPSFGVHAIGVRPVRVITE